jgi:hypothetical protein
LAIKQLLGKHFVIPSRDLIAGGETHQVEFKGRVVAGTGARRLSGR